MTSTTQGRRPTGPGNNEVLYNGSCEADPDREVTLYRDGTIEIIDYLNGMLMAVKVPPDAVLSKPVAAPEPDWSKAPEWAMWTTVNATGLRQWWGNKMPWYSTLRATWINGEYPGKYATSGHEVIPLGCDWRTTLRSRPEVGDE